MSVVGSTLMRRGFEAHAYVRGKEVKLELPPWVLAMMVVTFVVLLFVLFTIEYTFGRVIPTLMMIESPQEDGAFEPVPTEDNDGMTKDPEPISIRPQFITSNFRRSIQLLKSKGGFKARYRGLGMFIAHNWAVQLLVGVLNMVTGYFLPVEFYTVVAAVAAAQLSLGWTLIVITEPSPKYWFRRIPSDKLWKKIAGPTALHAIAEQTIAGVAHYLAIGLGLNRDPEEIAKLPASEQKMIIIKGLAVLVLSLVLAIVLMFPANVMLTRVQASLVSDAEETIVPFDRTFGGKVVPEIVGGTGRVGILDAWKTFDWSARIRLVKAYTKVIAMTLAAIFFFTGVFAIQGLLFAPGVHNVFVPNNGN